LRKNGRGMIAERKGKKKKQKYTHPYRLVSVQSDIRSTESKWFINILSVENIGKIFFSRSM
jgi:hypothetical protein